MEKTIGETLKELDAEAQRLVVQSKTYEDKAKQYSLRIGPGLCYKMLRKSQQDKN